MIIQPILFPIKNFIDEPELFFRGVEKQNIYDDKLVIPAGSYVSLETYFNAFSIGKWLEYTTLDNLSLHLKIEGEVEIEAYHAAGSIDADFYNREKGKHSEEEMIRLINERSYSAERKKTELSISVEGDEHLISFNELFKDGIFYITIKAVKDAALYGGYYATRIGVKKLNPAKLALGICTFRKEEFVIGNVNRVLRDIINDSSSPFYDKLEIYISDNGKTLRQNQFDSDKVHIFPNPNLGGVGGFTRTMIEAMFYDKAKDFSHIIFMDDDIILYPPILERNYYLLQLLKPEYQKAILGGEMLYINKMYMHHACGALYKENSTELARANHKFFDLRNPDAVSANEVVTETNHTGWMYACIPRTIINENNLPMPLFIHFDDVEYGLRNLKNKEMYINGIAIWHASPTGKSPSWMVYYNTRNRLITMFTKPLDEKKFRDYASRISIKITKRLTQNNFLTTRLMLDAISDFIKGPAVFMGLDAFDLHSALAKNNHKYVTPEEAGVSVGSVIKTKRSGIKKALCIQILCNLLPSFEKIRAIDSRYYSIPYTAKKTYLYNENLGMGIVCEKRPKEFFKLLFKFIKVRKELVGQYKKLLHDWQTAKPQMTSLAFWERYLGLEHK